jgi:hypothetical protein
MNEADLSGVEWLMGCRVGYILRARLKHTVAHDPFTKSQPTQPTSEEFRTIFRLVMAYFGGHEDWRNREYQQYMALERALLPEGRGDAAALALGLAQAHERRKAVDKAMEDARMAGVSEQTLPNLRTPIRNNSTARPTPPVGRINFIVATGTRHDLEKVGVSGRHFAVHDMQMPKRGRNGGYQRKQNRNAAQVGEGGDMVSIGRAWRHGRLDHFVPRTPVQLYRLPMTLHGAQRKPARVRNLGSLYVFGGFLICLLGPLLTACRMHAVVSIKSVTVQNSSRS